MGEPLVVQDLKKMEISNEIKAKVFGQYLGHKIRFDYAGPNQWNKLTPMHLTLDSPYKLLLKPLSAISDEDAEEIAKIGCTNYEWIKEQIQKGHDWRLRGEMVDILRGLGYDCRNGLLGGKTLKECDLCTYE